LVDAVDDAVVGLTYSGGVQEGREPIGDVHDLVADHTGSNVAGPAGDARRAQVALAAGEVRALPVAGRSAPQEGLFGAVVAGKYDEGLVFHPELVEQVEEGAEIGVELEQAVRPVSPDPSCP
jgi:hypothetical protein